MNRGRGRVGSRSKSGASRGGKGRGQSIVKSDQVGIREKRQERIQEIEVTQH